MPLPIFAGNLEVVEELNRADHCGTASQFEALQFDVNAFSLCPF